MNSFLTVRDYNTFYSYQFKIVIIFYYSNDATYLLSVLVCFHILYITNNQIKILNKYKIKINIKHQNRHIKNY